MYVHPESPDILSLVLKLTSVARRTRQNLMKMEQRRLLRERKKQQEASQQPFAVQQPTQPASGGPQKSQMQKKRELSQKRRARKEKERARKAGMEAMEIG